MRARSIKPGFFKNEDLADLPPEARLLFAGLWTVCDREGRCEDRPKRIKAEVLPYDAVDVDELLGRLQQSPGKFIVRYEVNGDKFIAIPSWHRHQNPHHMEPPSEFPPPTGESNKFNHSPITKAQRERIFARDKGKCVTCGASKNLSIDHIIPVSKGGTSLDNNLRTMCLKCNSKKGASVPKSSTGRDRVDIESSTGRDRVDGTASCPTDSGLRTPDSGLPVTDSGVRCRNGSPNGKYDPQPLWEFVRGIYPKHRLNPHMDLRLLIDIATPDVEATIRRDLPKRVESDDWRRDGGKFVPKASKYLGERLFEIPLEPEPQADHGDLPEFE